MIDDKAGGSGNILYLPLDKLMERSNAAPAQQARADGSGNARGLGRFRRRPQPGGPLMPSRSSIDRRTRGGRAAGRVQLAVHGVRIAARDPHPVRRDPRLESYPPGLHFKWPWDKDRIVKFDKRILSQTYQGETFLTNDNRGLIVDFYMKWRVKNASRYFQATGGQQKRRQRAPRGHRQGRHQERGGAAHAAADRHGGARRR